MSLIFKDIFVCLGRKRVIFGLNPFPTYSKLMLDMQVEQFFLTEPGNRFLRISSNTVSWYLYFSSVKNILFSQNSYTLLYSYAWVQQTNTLMILVVVNAIFIHMSDSVLPLSVDKIPQCYFSRFFFCCVVSYYFFFVIILVLLPVFLWRIEHVIILSRCF